MYCLRKRTAAGADRPTQFMLPQVARRQHSSFHRPFHLPKLPLPVRMIGPNICPGQGRVSCWTQLDQAMRMDANLRRPAMTILHRFTVPPHDAARLSDPRAGMFSAQCAARQWTWRLPRPRQSPLQHRFVSKWSSAEGIRGPLHNTSGLDVTTLSLTGTISTTA